MTQYIKYVDVTKCDGCRACMVACKNWNDLPAEYEEFHGSIQSHENLTANTWNVITYDEVESKEGNFEWLFRHMSCLHCTEAACEKACPEDAISHTEFGTVFIDYDKCVGCGYCVTNCPFDVVQLTTYKDKNGREQRRAQKCTQCVDRLREGLKPACVTACHTDCLLFDDEATILDIANKRLEVVKDRFPNANIYNPPGIKGTKTVYLLADKPSVYGLPEDPQVPLSQIVWKDYARPLGKAFFGVTTMAVVGAAVSSALFKNKDNSEEGGQKHEQ